MIFAIILNPKTLRIDIYAAAGIDISLNCRETLQLSVIALMTVNASERQKVIALYYPASNHSAGL